MFAVVDNVRLLWILWDVHEIYFVALKVKGSAVFAGILCSVLGLHFFYPGHVPVPRFLLPEGVALYMKRRIQDTEGGGWWGEVYTKKKMTWTWTMEWKNCIKLSFTFYALKEGNRISKHGETSEELCSCWFSRLKIIKGFFQAAVCHWS